MALPTTGTAALLERLSPLIPDDEVLALLPRHRGSGRRSEWSSSQLFRVLLLLLLTPARSTNLLCQLLPEQRAWRRFAYLPNRRQLPNVRQLHEFRARLTPAVLRHLNEGLLRSVLADWPADQPGIAVMDATDLPAATNEYKKSPGLPFRPGKQPSADERSRPASRVGSSGIRNIRCGCGCRSPSRRCCWCPS